MASTSVTKRVLTPQEKRQWERVVRDLAMGHVVCALTLASERVNLWVACSE